MSTRRSFLTATAATIATAALPKSLFAERLGGDVFTNASLGAYTQGLLTQATFEKHMGSVFTLFLENDAVGYLRLQKVGCQPAANSTTTAASQAINTLRPTAQRVFAAAHPQIASFHLTFSTSAVFSQGAYLVDHGILGRFAIFLVPGDAISGNGSCGATFCYLSNAAISDLAPPKLRVSPISTRVGPGTFH